MLVDITQVTKIGKVCRPGSPPLEVSEIFCKSSSGSSYKTIQYSIATHNMGTHIDVMGIDIELPLDRYIGKGIVFDVSSVRGREVVLEDVDLSRIKGGEFVFFHTGWSKYYDDDEKYQNHPEISISLIQELIKLDINMVGVDTLGFGIGKNHGTIDRILEEAGKYAIENLTNLDKIPLDNFKVYCLPTKIEGLDALPVRILVEY